jgi:tRNA(Ile)-lysidine synthetase-like protein
MPRADRMNADPRFLRTRVRNLLGDMDAATIDTLARLAGVAQARWPVLQRALDAIEDVEMTENETRFHSLPDEPALRRALLHRHIRRLDPRSRDVSRADLERIERSLGARMTVTKHLELDGLTLRRMQPPAVPIESTITVKAGAEGEQQFMLPPGAAPAFTVRNRRPGDRFHPLGAPGSKKLKDFLIDRKIRREERDRIPLLVWNGEIVWVAGIEISERFKVREGGGDLYAATLHYSEK